MPPDTHAARSSFTDVSPHTLHDVTERIRELLEGREVILISSVKPRDDPDNIPAMHRRDMMIGGVRLHYFADRMTLNIYNDAEQIIAIFAPQGLSVLVDNDNRMVQITKPTIGGVGLWVFVA